jgi:hypothetical protein
VCLREHRQLISDQAGRRTRRIAPGSAASMRASTALTLVSEMPPDGMREAFWICTSVAFTKSLEVVPKAAFSRSHQRF